MLKRTEEDGNEGKINGCGMESDGNALAGRAKDDHADHERTARKRPVGQNIR